ncbi:conserved hypothetical protein [Pediculus humanus corporis]|uniref:tRNA-splicing endonuclease subunit Sen34 n=1 Tax=Pediculus humanus subsp. corporis TaxID=121224 RepID=E0VW20_PEDHC|nr:uncharacterized protein Phum_PHUM473000 [Pediculus humanus corporis]EEB17576.1 conserved hypothetical protein [Pediculus humanus corporis]
MEGLHRQSFCHVFCCTHNKPINWLKLRSLRIIGNFIGNLATSPKQDKISALPLQLLDEEVTLLLEKGYAILKTFPSLSEPPNEKLKEKSKAYRERFLQDQAEILTEKRKSDVESKLDLIIEGKTKKRNANNEDKNESDDFDRFKILQEECQKAEAMKYTGLAIQINTCNIKYLIYKNLWEKGFYITPGGKFGADFLAYPGDPVKFHAFFIVVCLKTREKLQLQDVITYGRLGHSVKKTVVLAYLNDNNDVSYFSIQWSGF